MFILYISVFIFAYRLLHRLSVQLFWHTFAQARSQDCKFGDSFSFWGADIFRVLLYCYSLLAMSTVSVTEYTNIVVIKYNLDLGV